MKTFHRAIRRMFKELAQDFEVNIRTNPDLSATKSSTYRLSRHALDIVHAYVLAFSKKVSELSHDARRQEHKKTLMVRHVQFAANRLYQNLDLIADALLEFEAKMGFMKGVRRERKAELMVPVALCEKLLRQSEVRIKEQAIIAMASLVESFCRHLLPSTSTLKTFYEQHKRITIKTSDLIETWFSDAALPLIFSKIHLDHPTLLGYNPELHYQNTHCRLLKKQPFSDIVRDLSRIVACHELRFEAQAMRDLQHWFEYKLVQLLKSANVLCQHANRKTCSGKDLNCVHCLNYKRQPLPNNVEELVVLLDCFKGGFRKLCRRAGIERTSKSLIASLPFVALTHLYEIMNHCIHFLNTTDKTTVTHEIIQWSIRDYEQS